MSTHEIILDLIKINYSSDVAFEEAAGLKRKTVDNWKRGLSKSYLKMIPKLCELFNVKPDYILGIEIPDATSEHPALTEHQLLVKMVNERAKGKSSDALKEIIAMMDQIENQSP